MSATQRLSWRQLELPPIIPPAQVRAVLVALAALPNQPRLVLEALATAGQVSWRLGADDDVTVRKAARLVTTHVPEARISAGSDLPDTDDLTVAGQVKMSRVRELPLADPEAAGVTRGLLGALSQASPAELVRLQLVLGARTWPHRQGTAAGGHQRYTSGKHEQHGFGCALRIAARSGSLARARQLVTGVAAALRGLESPDVAITLGRVGTRSVATASSPFLWPLWLSVDDLVPLLAWPTSPHQDAELPGVPPRHPRQLPALAMHPSEGVPLGLASVDLRRGVQRVVAQAPEDALRHRHVLGPTGVGKSTLLGNLALADIAAGRGVVVIDPKADLVNDLLARIPEDRLDDVVVLDPSSDRPVGINPLTGVDPDLAADSIVAVFKSLFKDAMGPRSADILHASVLTLARRGDASLVMLPLLLTNPGFRRSLTGREAKADPLGLGAFWAGFEGMSDQAREQALRPLLNKLRQVMLRPSLRAVFGQRTPAFQLSDVFTKQTILLVKLGKDTIGPEAAQLLGSLLVSQLWQTALGRTSVAHEQRTPVMVTIDEVQDYLRLPGSLADALAQARGLGVGITAAHQHRKQLGSLLEDMEANTRTKVYFQLGSTDARAVAEAHPASSLTRQDFAGLEPFHAYASILTGNQPAPWVSLTTQPLPTPLRRWQEVQRRSASRYGQPLDDIEADLLALLDAPGSRQAPDRGPGRDEHTAGLGRRRTAKQATGTRGQEEEKSGMEEES